MSPAPLAAMMARRVFIRPATASVFRVPGRRMASKSEDQKLEQAPKRDPELYVCAALPSGIVSWV